MEESVKNKTKEADEKQKKDEEAALKFDEAAA
jgi:hypothetical protein